MNRRTVMAVFAVLASAAAVFPQVAYSQSLKDALVGTWSVTSVVDQYESGKKINNWGTVKGNLSFDAAGRFSQIVLGDAQPALKTADPRKPDAPVVAYYGSYVVNEGKKTVTFNLEAASYSARAGAASTSTVEVKGDVMTLIGAARKDQEGTFTPHLVLKRQRGL
jgi:hypothetical protein